MVQVKAGEGLGEGMAPGGCIEPGLSVHALLRHPVGPCSIRRPNMKLE